MKTLVSGFGRPCLKKKSLHAREVDRQKNLLSVNFYLMKEEVAEIKISEIHKNKGGICRSILCALPQWFGIEKAIMQYALDAESMLTFAATFNNEAIGFITVKIHNQ